MTAKQVAKRANLPAKDVAPPHPKNNVIVLHNPGQSPDEAAAKHLVRPHVQAAATIQAFDPALDVNYLAAELADHARAVMNKDLGRAETMLISQATTLDAIFNGLARKSRANMDHQYLDAAETYLRLALKAQSQCRATLETLGALQNPPVVFAKQANFAAGHQQVNNRAAAPTQAGKTESAPNELLEDLRHEQFTVDAGAPGKATAVDPVVATVGRVKRAANTRRKGAKCA